MAAIQQVKTSTMPSSLPEAKHPVKTEVLRIQTPISLPVGPMELLSRCLALQSGILLTQNALHSHMW